MGGGESKTETRYNYIDNSQKLQEEENQKEKRRLESERRQQELKEQERIARKKREVAERERQSFLTQQRNEESAEQKRKTEEQESLEREKQKQIELEQEALTKRVALFDYKFGDKINLAGFHDLDISDIKKLRIGVFGPTGSGKSCFINTCERTVRKTDKGSVPVATTGAEGTLILEDFLPEMFFRLVDTRGFFSYNNDESHEFSDILYGRIKTGDAIERQPQDDKENKPNDFGNTDAAFDDWLHGIILVVKANDPRLHAGAFKDYLLPVRKILRPIGISPITVVTHRDTLKSDEECEDALDLASAATGSSRSHTFFVTNYCPDNPGPNVNTELHIFNILHFALVTTERYVKIAKQQMKNKMEDELQSAMDGINTDAVPAIAKVPVTMFLEVLQSKHKWTENSVKTVTTKLHDEDVKKLETLVELWSDVKEFFPMGMRKMVEKELRKMKMLH